MDYMKKSETCPEFPSSVDGESFQNAFNAFASKMQIKIDVRRNMGKFLVGKPVRRDFVEGLQLFLKSRRLDYSLGMLGEPCDLEEGESGRDPLGQGGGFEALLKYFSERMEIDDSAYFKAADFQEAAKLMLHGVGKYMDPKANPDRALKRGGEEMARNVDFLADQLAMNYENNSRSVLYARYKAAGQKKIAGICWVIPVTEDFYDQVLAGEKEDYDLTPSDLLPVSARLLVVMVPNMTENAKAYRLEKGIAIAKTIMYQFASLTPFRGGDKPRIIAQVNKVLNSERSASVFGFQRVGSVTPHTGMDVMELRPPTRKGTTRDKLLEVYSAYGLFLTIRGMVRIGTDALKPPPY